MPRIAPLLLTISLVSLLSACGKSTEVPSLDLTSSAFSNNQAIPAKYTCDGDGSPPSLQIGTPPKGTKSFVLLVDDIDAGRDKIFVHWMAWNIQAESRSINGQTVGSGAVIGLNSSGKLGYTPPCPPAGKDAHHYVFQVYALDTLLGIKPPQSRDQLKKAMQYHVLAKGTLVGTYLR